MILKNVSTVSVGRRWMLALAVCVVALDGCANMSPTGQRALSGGAIGAAGGAILGTVAAGNPAVGAAVGGAVGAGVGAALPDIERTLNGN
ncbi:hypothetical protein [Acidithiobacillus sp.]|jgi:hypothetical protein|uniref:hypothetical protein n=1 Tax=Acidithiobacillus sp. TaxID=1872118 RepID=UPI0025BAE957|nr:hypothetical protein [Acidithiobacillus sp.]MCK9188327.1 hypothetical protein [Acidithiobacillus sp.]MCK9360149.1 hypothetical protein [Acidithiobacillus sp.]